MAEQASFCASEGFERLRRFQTARTRELLRTIDLLAKLRKAEASASAKKAPNEANPPAPRKPAPRPMPHCSDPIETLVAEGMTDYLAKLLQAGEHPSRSPKNGANEANPRPCPASSSRPEAGASAPIPAIASPGDRAEIRVPNRANEANLAKAQVVSGKTVNRRPAPAPGVNGPNAA